MIRLVDLHPLSLENLLQVPGGPRSGADYYKNHLFIRVLSHTLKKDGEQAPNFLEQIARPSSPEPLEPEGEAGVFSKDLVDDGPSGLPPGKSPLPPGSGTTEPEGHDTENMGTAKTPTRVDYGSFYATYVYPFLPSPFACSDAIFLKSEGIRLTRLSAKLCKSSRRVKE